MKKTNFKNKLLLSMASAAMFAGGINDAFASSMQLITLNSAGTTSGVNSTALVATIAYAPSANGEVALITGTASADTVGAHTFDAGGISDADIVWLIVDHNVSSSTTAPCTYLASGNPKAAYLNLIIGTNFTQDGNATPGRLTQAALLAEFTGGVNVYAASQNRYDELFSDGLTNWLPSTNVLGRPFAFSGYAFQGNAVKTTAHTGAALTAKSLPAAAATDTKVGGVFNVLPDGSAPAFTIATATSAAQPLVHDMSLIGEGSGNSLTVTADQLIVGSSVYILDGVTSQGTGTHIRTFAHTAAGLDFGAIPVGVEQEKLVQKGTNVYWFGPIEPTYTEKPGIKLIWKNKTHDAVLEMIAHNHR